MARKVELVIDCDSDDFADNLPVVLARVLRRYASELEDDAFKFPTERARTPMDVIMRIPIPAYTDDGPSDEELAQAAAVYANGSF